MGLTLIALLAVFGHVSQAQTYLTSGSLVFQQYKYGIDECLASIVPGQAIVIGKVLGACRMTDVEESEMWMNCFSNSTHYSAEYRSWDNPTCSGNASRISSGRIQAACSNVISATLHSCIADTSGANYLSKTDYPLYEENWSGDTCSSTPNSWMGSDYTLDSKDCYASSQCWRDDSVTCKSSTRLNRASTNTTGGSNTIAANLALSTGVVLLMSSMFL